MNIIKCKLCREPFNSHGSRVCSSCLELIDKDFFVVRDYIYDNPGQTKVDQIAEATGVKEAHIVYLLEEGRLAISGGIGATGYGPSLKCQICGRNIPAGNMCESCKSALTKELGAGPQTGAAKQQGSYVSPRSSRTN